MARRSRHSGGLRESVRTIVLGSSIRGRFWRALAIVGLIPAVVLAAHFTLLHQSHLTAEARNHLATQATLQAVVVETILEQAGESIAVLAANPAIVQYQDDLAMVSEQLKAYGLFEEVTLLHPRGAILATTSYGFSGRWDANAAFRGGLDGRQVMTPPLFYPDPDRLVVEFAAPVVEADEVIAVLVGSMNMDRVWRALEDSAIGSTGFVMVLDRHGNVIAHPDQGMLLRRLEGYPALSAAVVPRTISYQPPDGEEYVGHESIVTDADWRVVAMQERSDADSMANAALAEVAVVLPVVMLLTLLAATLLSRANSRPMQQLGLAMQHVARGDLEHRVEDSGLEEIDEVVASFNTMATTLDQRSDSLRAEMQERDRAEARITYQAYHDSLTGLPNRALLKDRLEVALSDARRTGEPLAVIFIDLDRFKHVNDSVGHSSGDTLLRGAADRIQKLIREGDSVARVGGDEYVMLLPRVSSSQDAIDISDRVLDALREPWMLDGREYRITASLGLAMFPADGADADTLLRNADTAMYVAKDDGRDAIRHFSVTMDASLQELVRLEQALRNALTDDELMLYYQPQIDIDSGRVVGVEALLRWKHPDRGVLDASQFISVAEETGLIWEVGRFAMYEACAQARRWRDAGLLDDIPMAVNVSARQFHDVGIIDVVRGALDASGLAPNLLDLEITESTAMRDVEHTARILAELKATGVNLSIDDFGTGYSSLSYLKRLPIDTVKIDRSFVKDIANDADDAAIVSAIIAVANSLNMKIVAEGVETEEQVRFLRRLGCTTFQGYLHSRALPEADLAAQLFKNARVESGQPGLQRTATAAASLSLGEGAFLGSKP